MKKKILIISAAAVAVTVAAVLLLTNMFTKGVITDRLYRVDNVYEEIWNMVKAEAHGTQTILTASTDGAEVDYDLGCFCHVNIPVNDGRSVTLSFSEGKLWIRIYENYGKSTEGAQYAYSYRTNTLYGDHAESHLIDSFTSLYYSWSGSEGKFTPDNQGDYTFVLSDDPSTYE